MSDIPEHLVKSYDQELAQLQALLTTMGELVTTQVSLAKAAVVDMDVAAAARAAEIDSSVDAAEREVEQLTIRMIALRQPLGGDLRRIVGALKATSDLERIGDHAVNVAKRSLLLNQSRPPDRFAGLIQMIQLVEDALTLIVEALTDYDADKALQVWRSDAAIDDSYNTIVRVLVTYMMEDPRSISACMHMLFIAKSLERVGDHATNIAEVVHFAVTGEVLMIDRPKGAPTAYATDHEGGTPA